MGDCKKYRLRLSVDNNEIEINSAEETNYRGGEALLLSHLFYRGMLALGYSPVATGKAMLKSLESNGADLDDALDLIYMTAGLANDPDQPKLKGIDGGRL